MDKVKKLLVDEALSESSLMLSSNVNEVVLFFCLCK